MSIIIRPAIPEDIEQVIRVQVQGWKESYQGLIDQFFLDSMAYSDLLMLVLLVI